MKTILYILCVAGLLTTCKSPQKITSVNADVDGAGFTETHWRLTELRGKQVPPAPEGGKDIYIVFKNEDNNLEGFAGCNGIGGKYELKDGNRIRVTNIIGTMMACDDLKTENALLEVLRIADNYNLNRNQLVMNKARMAPLARFESFKLK